jgi:hypothetical protein
VSRRVDSMRWLAPLGMGLVAGACSGSSASSTASPPGPKCAPLMYISGENCRPLDVNDGARVLEDATAADGEGSLPSGGDAGETDAPPSSSDAGVDLSACSNSLDDVFVIGGDDFVYYGSPLTLEGGAGWSVSYQSDPATGLPDAVSIGIVSRSDGDWDVELSTIQLGRPFAVQTYTDAELDPFEDPGHPGLSVSGDGRACDTVTGNFQVLAIEVIPGDSGAPGDAGDALPAVDAAPPPAQLRSFTATFEQHCQGGSLLDVGCVHVTL